MASIEFGQLISNASGKVAGIVFTRDKSGAKLRTLNRSCVVRNKYTSGARSDFANMNKRWEKLTPAQRTAWNTAASGKTYKNRLGQEMQITGANYFVKINIHLLGIVDTPLLLPLAAPDPIPEVFNLSNLTLRCEVTEEGEPFNPVSNPYRLFIDNAGLIPVNQYVRGLMSKPLKPSAPSSGKVLRLGSILNSTTVFPLDVTAQYTGAFGAIIPANYLIRGLWEIIYYDSDASIDMWANAEYWRHLPL